MCFDFVSLEGTGIREYFFFSLVIQPPNAAKEKEKAKPERQEGNHKVAKGFWADSFHAHVSLKKARSKLLRVNDYFAFCPILFSVPFFSLCKLARWR